MTTLTSPAPSAAPLLLSRTLDPGDYALLQPELSYVGQYYKHTQHPHRHWEYAMALHAISRWEVAHPDHHWTTPVYDIGGIGSEFYQMLRDYGGTALVVDALSASGSVAEHCAGGTPLADIVTALGVIQRVPDQEAFLYYASCLLAPGGLLVLTFDYWNRCGADTARDHTLRQRIYCPKLYAQLRQQAQVFQLQAFGGVDPTWHGAHVHDYSYASLVLEKRR